MKPSGFEPELLELGARPQHELGRGRGVEVVELALVRGVDARGEDRAQTLRRAAPAQVIVAVDDDLVPRRVLLLQPLAEGRVFEKIAGAVVVRHDEQRAFLQPERRQVLEDRVARRAGLRRDIVDGNDERVRVERTGARGGLGGAVTGTRFPPRRRRARLEGQTPIHYRNY